MKESIKSYYEKTRNKKVNKTKCPGDYGLDCPEKYFGFCPVDSTNCWEEEVSEDNISYIRDGLPS